MNTSSYPVIYIPFGLSNNVNKSTKVNKETAKGFYLCNLTFANKQMLYVKTKVHDVSILHYIIPAFKTPASGILDR